MEDETKIELGIYRHYKGGTYRVIGTAKHSETLEDLVIYEALYDNATSKLWARPAQMFFDEVEWEGKRVKIFALIGNLVAA